MTPLMSFMNPDRLWWLAVPVAIALLYLVLAARWQYQLDPAQGAAA